MTDSPEGRDVQPPGSTGGVRARRAAPPSRRSRIWLATAVVAVLLGLISHGHYAGSGDAVHYMMIARSLSLGGDLDLSDDYGDPGNILSTPPERHALPGPHGTLRPVHDVGLPLLAAPYFAVAYRLADQTDRLPENLRRRAKLDRFIALRQLMSLFMIAITAWLGIVFFDICSQMSGDPARSWIWTLVWVLSPPILTHGYVFLTEVPSALLALIVYRRRDTVVASAWQGAALGLLTGLLVLVHVRNVGLVAGLVLITLWRARGRTWPIAYLAGLAVLALCKIGLNVAFWGTMVTTPHAQLGAWPGAGAVVAATVERGIGLLVDARHGLLPVAPVYLAAPAAWMMLWRRSRGAAVEVLVVTAAYLLFVLFPITNVHGWRGGWSPAARFLVPIAPLLMLGGPGLLADRIGRWIVAVLLLVQVPLDGFIWAHPMLTWSEGLGMSPLAEAVLGSAIASRLPTVVGSTTGVLVAWLAALAAWMVAFATLVRNGRHPTQQSA